ncbi:Plastidal glycolate/glycerate translocator 1 [Hibiscus syriacus]|uniref:Plastidal glycolate/glycerate translocator 1 n=1 Tax=Hibiscus syriacus TaxID=106335 RepID=A0A6A3C6R8_HIBSY|nr:plastidal glycolate/glycerate translocator 1, chloroplastic-like [Hibiscus syriacus]KAE8724177.1 Plastidal glycolate/glycerate translocator 1 [Hibiscus syriacus]
MASPLVTTTLSNLSLSLLNHRLLHSSSFSSPCFPFNHRSRRNPTPVSSHGNPQLFKHEDNHSTAPAPHKSTSVVGPKSKFLQMDPPETSTYRETLVKSSASDGSSSSTTSSLSQKVFGVLHLVVSLGIVLSMDNFLKKAFVAAAIKFPSALFGMFCIFSVLVILDSTIPAAATSLMNFFEPALMFIQRWLPLFYVPALVVLPLSVRDIPAASGLKICFIIAGGWLASLCVAGFSAIAVRKIVKTEMIDAEPMKKPSPFSPIEFWAWGGIFLSSFVSALFYPTALGTAARTCLPFLLASTVLGYMIGSGLPSGLKKVFHPIICCALSADLAAVAFGYLSGSGVDAVLGDYLTKVSSNPGAGDILMGFLGSVILSFAFSMFKQRKLVKRHAAEIFISIILSSLFSLYSTALVGRLVGLEPSLTISILPRCITVALALSIVSFFEGANSSLTAAAVVVTGLIGANFVQATLDKLRFRDPIARGIATASSAHGLGTAALSAKEPEALPFCAIAYGLTGIFGSLFCSVPVIRQSLIAIVG